MSGRARFSFLCRTLSACSFRVVVLSCLLSNFIFPGLVSREASAQTLSREHLRPRIDTEVEDRDLVVLKGNHPNAAIPRLRIGLVAPETRMEKMILALKPDAVRQQSLDALVAGQRDPRSPQYR